MSSKVYSDCLCSELEAGWNGLETTTIPYEATHYVNPMWENLVGKEIIISLPTDIDLVKLSKYNKIISRYPLTDFRIKYELIPYTEDNFKIELDDKPCIPRILNKWLLTSTDSEFSSKDRFLLGAGTEVNGYLTTIGLIIKQSNHSKQN